MVARGADVATRGNLTALKIRAWTLRAHPEFVAPLAERLLAGRVELIGAERVAAARASLTRSLDREAVGGWIAHLFATSPS